MTLKVGSTQNALFSSSAAEDIKVDAIKKQLIAILQDFPYENVNLEKDTHITDVLDLIKDDVKIDRSQIIIPKEKLLEALLSEPKETQSIESTNLHMNPVMKTMSYFNLVAQSQEQIKAQQYSKFQNINQDLDLIGQALSLVQTQAQGDKLNLSTQDQAKAIIDQVRQKWGFPEGSAAYTWENKSELISFLTQKQKELTHRSQEVMMHLQHSADQLKAMVDATKEIIKSNNELCEYINRKTAG